jgi:ribonucleoside-diphosphate reductase alpha chain
MAVDPSAVRIDLSRDNLFDAFTLQTYRDRYQLPDETSPQHALARASAAFADDVDHAQRLYDYVSKGWFMFATPLLSNGGTDRGLPISCFLSTAEDSREGIFDHWTETGWLSSVGGGVGGYWPLRSAGKKTSKGSSSTGQIPFIAVMDRLILAVSQGGTRRGSYAAYVDVDHPEVEEFVTMRKPTGGDANRKGTNIHNAINITDAFMIAVRDDTSFDLRDPKTREVTKTIQARGLWRLIIDTRMQTGEPYLHFVDASNRALPEAQKKKGLKVNQSNLCVAPDTELLTSEGYKPISALVGIPSKVWNGERWSSVTVEHTGINQELMRVWFEDGSHLDCTPYHKFYDADGIEIRAGELKAGTVLEEALHPVVELATDTDYGVATAYTAGWATFAGFEEKNRLSVFVPSDHATVPSDPILKRLLAGSVDFKSHEDGFYIHYEPRSVPAGRAPMRWTVESRLSWLAGALDAAGEWMDLGEEGMFLSVASLDADLVKEMRLAALESGLNPRIRITDAGAGFMLNAFDVRELVERALLLSFEPPEVDEPDTTQIVADVHPLPWKTDTFCFSETGRRRGVFNGVLTGNCTEITLATGRDDQGNKRTAVCCLSSVNAVKWDEWRHDPRFLEDLFRMLDNTLQVFIEKAPPELAYAVYSAIQERSVGLGLLGFHSALQDRLIPFASNEARAFNMQLFKHIRRQADAASLKLGVERGEAPDMAGTGERFAHKLAIAPNASSSILCGNISPSTEPSRANAFLHKTLSGSFPVKNQFLARELAKIGMDTPEVWKSIIANEGSVQQLDIPELLKRVFETATELKQLWIIIHGADRQPEICQAQSINVFFPSEGADAEEIVETHYRAWEWGLKSLYYLRSTTPKRAENTNTKIERASVRGEDTHLDLPDLAALIAAAGPVEQDESCFMCQG